MSEFHVLNADVLTGLASLPDASVRCCVTSPPYWGLRDYGHEGQIGLESTPELYVSKMVEVFREVRRVLADDGTLWLNLGDSYAGIRGNTDAKPGTDNKASSGNVAKILPKLSPGLKAKDLVGIPWRVAFALQADGWYLRSDIIWAKPNPMPESVTDRPTKAHEYLFLLAKSQRYYYDAKAVAELAKDWSSGGPGEGIQETWHYGANNGGNSGLKDLARRYKSGNKDRKPATERGCPEDGVAGSIPRESNGTRNRRTVWTINSQAFPGAHFAVMPEALVEPCVLAGSAAGDTVLDPFAGSGTVGVVANRHGRNFVGVELNPKYAEMARNRIRDDAPMFNVETVPMTAAQRKGER